MAMSASPLLSSPKVDSMANWFSVMRPSPRTTMFWPCLYTTGSTASLAASRAASVTS